MSKYTAAVTFLDGSGTNVFSSPWFHADKPVERTASAEADQPPHASGKPLPTEDLFGSVPFVANAGKS